MLKKINGLRNLIGNTPLLEIQLQYKGENHTIYAKAEHYNLSGSIKDRMALHIIERSYTNGSLKEGDKIVEATSGNTGISFSALGAAFGHEVLIYMPDFMSDERKHLIRSFGAKIQLVSQEEGGFIGCIRMTEDLASSNKNVFLPYQFSNEYNCDAHYKSTGPEIYKQLENLGLKADAVVAGVGTGGTIMGIGKFLRGKNSAVKVYPLEPSNLPVMTEGQGKVVGEHRIQGIGDDFIPDLVNLDFLDDVIQVDDGDSIIMAQKLALELGLGVGISSGANFLGALIAQEKLGRDAIVVTVFPDDNKKYLSTDLMKEEPVKDYFMTKDIKLISVIAHR